MTLDDLKQRAMAAGYEAEIAETEFEGEPRRRLIFGKPESEEEPPARVIIGEDYIKQIADSKFDEFLTPR